MLIFIFNKEGSTIHTLKVIVIFLLLAILPLGFQSCIEEIDECLSRTGKKTEQVYALDPFSQIEVNDGIRVRLFSSTEQRAVVRAGKNVITQISLHVSEGKLTIHDNNRCDWTRHHEEREVLLYVPQLSLIRQNGYGRISTDDTLQVDKLQIEARQGSGAIDLKLKAYEITVVSSRYGTISLEGKADRLHVQYLSNNAIFEGRHMKAKEVKVFQKSNNHFHLYPEGLLNGKLLRRGNIYLYHPPQLTDVEITGSGKIIPVY